MARMVDKILDQNEASNFFYILIGLLVMLSILFLMGGDEGLPYSLGRVISFIIVLLFAYSLLDWTSNITEKSDDLTDKDSLDENINLHIKDISRLLERASEGKEKSQEMVHEKLKKIFFLKLKEVKDISDNDLRDLVRNPEKFRKVVQDEVIADFILSLEKKSDGTKTRRSKFLSSSEMNSQRKYKKKMKEIIQRIDKWEERYHG